MAEEKNIQTLIKLRCKSIFFVFLISGVFLLTLKAEAASLYFTSPQTTYGVGQSFSVRVLASSNDQAMNAASAVINFPNDKLQIIGLTKSSLVSFWAEQPSYSNTGGSADFEGVIFNPGYTGQSGQLLTITFRALKEGVATISFASGEVLANDGLGTNITSGLGTLSLTITAQAPVVKPEGELPPPPTITSPTHPNPKNWYSQKRAVLQWAEGVGITGMLYDLDTQASTTPKKVIPPKTVSTSTEELSDGRWFFHLMWRNAIGWSETSHYSLGIDTLPPQPFTIRLLDGEETTSRQPKILLGAKDETSGVSKYEIFIDSNLILEIPTLDTSPYEIVSLPKQTFGKKTLKVIAYDQAGNTRESTTEFSVERDFFTLLLTILLVLTFTILGTLLCFFLLWKKEGRHPLLPKEKSLPEKVQLNEKKEIEEKSQQLERNLKVVIGELQSLVEFKNNQRVFSFLEECRKQGLSNEEIKTRLQTAGWKKEDIDLVFEEEAILKKTGASVQDELTKINSLNKKE